MRFGEKLRALRREKGLTQAELAKLAGVGLKTITNYEKGTTYPQNREVYGILARILGCDADYLHNEGDDFIAMAGQEYGYRGKKGAERLLKKYGVLFLVVRWQRKIWMSLCLPFRKPTLTRRSAIRNTPRKNISSRTMQSKSAVSDFISVKLKLYHSARKG